MEYNNSYTTEIEWVSPSVESCLNPAKPIINAILAQEYSDVIGNNLLLSWDSDRCIMLDLLHTQPAIAAYKSSNWKSMQVWIRIIFGTTNTKQITMSMCPLNMHRFNMKAMGVLSWQNKECYHTVGQQRSQLLSLDKPHWLSLDFNLLSPFHLKNLFCQKNFTTSSLGGRKKIQQYGDKRLHIRISVQHLHAASRI